MSDNKDSTGTRICDKCQKMCRPVPTPQTGLQHSEWYCAQCHKSYQMSPEIARALVRAAAQ